MNKEQIEKTLNIVAPILTILFFLTSKYLKGIILTLLVVCFWIDVKLELDAEILYEYAKDPRVGPIAGWPVHTSVDNSREIIRDVLSADGTYAVTAKGGNRAIGSIGLMVGDKSNLGLPETEAEIGYWIGVPFWGMGYIPEAAQELMRYAFVELKLDTIWCGYFDGNDKSRRVGEKCGFRFDRTEEKEWPLIGETKTQHITRLTKDEWREMQR